MLRELLEKISRSLLQPIISKSLSNIEQSTLSTEYWNLRSELKKALPENPANNGFKVFSQGDEDGVIQAILGRLYAQNYVPPKTFLEIGAGDGTENNTAFLALLGWKGVMIDGNPRLADNLKKSPNSDELKIIVEMLDFQSDLDSVKQALADLQGSEIKDQNATLGLLCIDIDSHDLVLLRKILKFSKPDILVLEYNASFPPPHSFTISDKSKTMWSGDNYYGASLGAQYEMLNDEYKLVATNLTGVNSFWVRNEIGDAFANYSLDQLYSPARHHLTKLRWGHAPSFQRWINN